MKILYNVINVLTNVIISVSGKKKRYKPRSYWKYYFITLSISSWNAMVSMKNTAKTLKKIKFLQKKPVQLKL